MANRRPNGDPDELCFGVRVTAGSRLSFTLIDVNGETGRRNGTASLSLRNPCLRAVVKPAGRTSVSLDHWSSTHKKDIESFLENVASRWSFKPVAVEVENGLPAHHGFGSKTTTLLALGKAYAELQRAPVPTTDLAKAAKRAGTSGASVNLIDRGGFLVDGGHLNPDDFDDDPQRYLLPSRYAVPARVPPVLVNLPFPPWPILLIITKGTQLHGMSELDWFGRTLPIPAEEARRPAHHVLMNLSTAVAEADYLNFCKALSVLTYEHHFKQQQIAIQPVLVRRMFHEAERREDIDAISMSVTGPMCFAFTRQPKTALAWCEELRERDVVQDFFFTSAQNHPCVLEGVPLE
jgi:beta-ribofuranosylaminobenzene 5'-phosphate synthase